MPRQWITEPEHEWEPLLGEPPSCQMSVHPSGDYVALQASVWLDTTTERAAVWDTRTKKIVWNPGDANAMAWVPGGNAILLLREVYCFEMRSWPSLDLIGSCPIEPSTGWLTDVVPSPNGSLACVVWQAFREIAVTVTVPQGWLPDNPGDITYELLGCPTFIDDSTVALELPTGHVRRFSVLAGGDSRTEGNTTTDTDL